MGEQLKRLYDWVLKRSQKPSAIWWLICVSFAESSFFPAPPDILLVPMCLSHRNRAWSYGIICTISSVIGGLFGYLVGYTLFESIGVAILEFYNYQDAFERVIAEFRSWAFWAIALKGLTPIPYKIVTIACGVAKIDLKIFLLASIIARSMRFLAISGLCWYYGEPVKKFIEKNLNKVAIGGGLLLIGGFLLFKFL